MSSLDVPKPSTVSISSGDTDHILIQEGSEMRSSFTDVDEGASAASFEVDRTSPNRAAGPNDSERQGHARTAGISATNGIEHLSEPKATSIEETPLPSRQRFDISDSNIKNAWARKNVLTLDGGGIKGYSTLLILRRLMKLIADIEMGKRPASQGDSKCWSPNHKSDYYPWFRDPQNKETAQSTPTLNNENDVIHDEVSEEELKQSCGDTSGTKDYLPRHYFDYIAGTSTGGLSAIMLGRLRMPIDDAFAQYDVVGNQVFGKPRILHRQFGFLNYISSKYRSRDMKKAILQVVKNGVAEELCQWEMGEDEAPLESDPAQCRTLAIAYGHHVRKGVKKDYIFRSYDHPAPSPLAQNQRRPLNPGRAHREPLWKIARATSAAPKYFSSIFFSSRIFRDGGMGANNPAELALSEVLQMHEHPPSLMLSVGTGKPEDTPQSESHVGSRPPVQKGLIKIRGDFHDVVALATESEKTEARVRERCTVDLDPKVEYFRFNVAKEMSQIMLDNWEPAAGGERTKEHITRLTNQYLHTRQINDDLLKCARILVQTRRDRAKTERWERFAAQYVYFCPEQDCNSAKNKYSKTYFERNELREHGINKHFALLGTPIMNGDNDGVAFTLACTHDSCVHKVHIFHSELQLRQHFEKHHQRTLFKKAEELEHWLDCGRMSQIDALLRARESWRAEYQWMRQKTEVARGEGSSQNTGTRTTPERDQNPADSEAKPGLTSKSVGSFRSPIKIKMQSFRKEVTHPPQPG
ncbi:MAG: hypothetical protein M1816_001151 [Peltula sp. TS41687]|nr:MAG: hypothetical protein M1816_001151 [Peltula sp. TS41687]